MVQGCRGSPTLHLVGCVCARLSSQQVPSQARTPTASRVPRLPFPLGSVEEERSSYHCANPESPGFDVITEVSGFKGSQDVPDSFLQSCFRPRFHSREPRDLSGQHESLSQTAARPCGRGDCGREPLAPGPENKPHPSCDDALSPSSTLDWRSQGLVMGLGSYPCIWCCSALLGPSLVGWSAGECLPVAFRE